MAIAYDTSTQSSASSSSVTFAHTCTGTSRCLIVDAYWSASATVSSITYGGVAMTNVVSPLDTGAGERHGMFYLVNPASGSNNVVLTLSTSTQIEIAAVSYTGVASAGTIDATRTETGLETGTSYTEAITSVADNCWAVWSTREYGGGAVSAGANTALRQQVLVYYGLLLADSNAAITPAGARTLELTKGVSGNWFSDILVTLKPGSGYSLDLSHGSFALTGQDTGFLRGIKILLEYGAFTLTGQNTILSYGRSIALAVGSFVLTGIATAFKYSGWIRPTKDESTTWTKATKDDTTSWTQQSR